MAFEVTQNAQNPDGSYTVLSRFLGGGSPGTPPGDPIPDYEQESYERQISSGGMTTREVRRIKDDQGSELLRQECDNFADGHPYYLALRKFTPEGARDGLFAAEFWPNTGRLKSVHDAAHFPSTTIPPGESGPLKDRVITKCDEQGVPFEFEFRTFYDPPNPDAEDNVEDLKSRMTITLTDGRVSRVEYKEYAHDPPAFTTLKYYEFNVSPTGVVSGQTSGGF